ncbi:unnamed protein product [Cyclocybe aegerita]|uniref:F-box domain-containing protein n=1 Tax=Cyclocybe aegerita TaxID=1973307 RepID=A0A8S0W0B5_CYCAE|nr:unnamed protein product [Cyclocybe aegerita]
MCLCTICGADGTSGHGSRYPVVPPRGSLMCYSCLELKNLEAQIADTKAFLNHLEAHIDLLKFNHNHTHDYFTHRLPPEVASHIFVLAVADAETLQDQHRAPLTLGAVSRRWRQIAWSTPRLWTEVPVDLNKFEESFHLPKELLVQWIGRAGQLPLSVHISFDATDSDSSRHTTNFTNIVNTLNEYSLRWESLSLAMPFSLVPHLRATHEVPLLKRLTINPPYRVENNALQHQGETFDICTVPPLLQDVSIEGFPFASIRINWSHVTMLHFGGISVIDCLCIFQQAPQITECSLRISNDMGILHLDNPIILPCLVQFEIHFADDIDRANALLDRISLPVLRHLEYEFDLQDYTPLARLLTRSSSPLTYLSITCHSHEGVATDGSLFETLRAAPTVEDLHLDITHLRKDFFDIISPIDAASNKAIFLPKLRQLSYAGKLTFGWLSFIRFIDSRQSIRAEDGRSVFRSITLDVDMARTVQKDNISIPWLRCIDELATLYICRLAERGMDIKILHGTVDMLGYSRQFHEQLRFGK